MLKIVLLPVVSEEKCRADLEAIKTELEVEPAVSESHICAGGEGGRDACLVRDDGDRSSIYMMMIMVMRMRKMTMTVTE